MKVALYLGHTFRCFFSLHVEHHLRLTPALQFTCRNLNQNYVLANERAVIFSLGIKCMYVSTVCSLHTPFKSTKTHNHGGFVVPSSD